MALTLRVGVYNVLAQTLAKSDYFPYVLHNALKLKSRWPALQRVLDELDADVLLLSELDRVDEYRAFLTARGYELLYRRRGAKQYGNGIAYRASKLRLVRGAALDMNDLADALGAGVPGTAAWHVVDAASGDGGAAAAEAHFRKDSVGLYAALAFVEPPPCAPPGVVVACSHLYWDPAMAAVRSAQAASLLLGAAEVARAVSGGAGGSEGAAVRTPWPVIVGGDFNSQPGTDSHRLLIRQPLPLGGAPVGGGAVPPLEWDTLAAPPSPPKLQPATDGDATAAAATAQPPTPPSRRAWLERLSEFVGAAVSSVAERWALGPPSPSAAGTASPAAAAPPAAEGPTLVSAYAAHAMRGVRLRLAEGSDPAPGAPLQLRPEGLPRAGLPLKHGAPPVPLPLLAYAAAAGAPTGGLVADAPDGSRVPLAEPLPAPTALALDVLAEPVMTTMTQSFTECLDYVLFTPAVSSASGGGLGGPTAVVRVRDVLRLPTAAEVTKDGDVAVPSRAHPSDHFPLVATLELAVEGAGAEGPAGS